MSDRTDLLIRVASYYYEDDMTQTDIAKVLDLSRPTVAKMLKEAREKGIVRITIEKRFSKSNELNRKQDHIARKYDLDTVLITESGSTDDETKARIGDLCARFVEDRLDKIETLGISWGTTLKAYVDAAGYFNCPHLSIVPMIGGVGLSEIEWHSNHLAFTLGQKYNAKSSFFYAPAIAENIEIKQALYNSQIIQEVLEAGRNVDLAIIGVGNPRQSKTYRDMGYISDLEEKEIINRDVIGDILTTFYNSEGEPVETSLSERMIGPSINDIKNIKDIVVIASGESKIISIQALLKVDIIDHLIIDEEIANHL